MSENQEPSNSKLHILLTEQRGDIKLILSKIDDFSKWKEAHDANDILAHAALHKRISDTNEKIENTNKRFNNVAIVSALIGVFVGSAVGAIKKFFIS